jgi:hypothetical protein
VIQRLVHFALHQRFITLALALLHRVVREVQHAAVEVARPPTLTLIPELTSFFFRRPPSKRESPLLRGLRRPYTSAINWCVRHGAEPDLHAASPRMGVREMVDY